MTPRLIFFDIDQTLIQSAGCGRRALQTAFKEILGVENALEGISMSGKTDTSIAFEVLENNRMLQSLSPKKDLFLWERYAFHLERELAESKEAAVAVGILDLLAALKQTPHTHLALLTGNIRQGAKLKLDRFGLWNYFPVGGFGDDHMDRNRVAQIALTRASEHFGESFDLENVFVVGDSLRDIQAANAIKAKAVSVATGLDPYERLQQEKPFALFRDFSNMAEVLHSFC